MENKYYTPDIKEFHIGFNFEFKTGIEGWKEFKIDNNKIKAVFENIIDHPSQFRVKFLDKEDIESLGWNGEPYKDNEITGLKARYEICEGVVEFPQIVLEPKGENGFLIFILEGEHAMREILFRGIINNKSELIKIMKQIGIYDTSSK